MTDPTRWSFLIPAAGEGRRLGRGPKALLYLDGATLLDRVIEVAREVSDDIVVGVPAAEVAAIARRYPEATVVAGGASRQATIEKLLRRAGRDWVVVHDAARPLCTVALIRAVADAALGGSGAAAAVDPIDVPVVLVEDGSIKSHIPARRAWTCQSPLAFRAELLRDAYAHAAGAGSEYASTLELVLAAGFGVSAAEGERRNIKITTDADLAVARAILAAGRDESPVE